MPPGPPHHVTILHMHAIYSDTQNTTKINISTVKWAQWDKNPIQRTVVSVHMCVHCTVHSCCTQYCTEQTW